LLGSKRPGEYPVLTMGGDRTGGEGPLRSGRPPGGRMRREIPFDDLPEAHRAAVLDAYRRLWDL
jgi:hypothetical protein